MDYNIFKNRDWFVIRHDARKKAFKGVTKSEWAALQDRHCERSSAQIKAEIKENYRSSVAKYKKILRQFSDVPYVYQGDGLDDFNRYQRPSSDGGYVSICVGEPRNNFHIHPSEDAATAAAYKHLMRLYNEYNK